MARHSKNNTANCVFTYGERQKLKSMNEWGQISSRIGADSQKKFEQCSLCLKKLEEPVACPKGHTFCKNCIIENLFVQKAEIKKRRSEWEERSKKANEKDNSTEKKAQIEKLIQFEDGILENEPEKDPIILPKMGKANENILLEKDNKRILIESLKEKKKLMSFKEKTELTRNCFWLPDAMNEAKAETEKPPSESLICPVKEKDHPIKLKELITIRITESKSENKFVCCICEKELSCQRIICLKKCGHVMCRKCLDSVCKKDETCTICNERYFPSEIITLQESGTSYSIHNQVITNKLNPYFKY